MSLSPVADGPSIVLVRHGETQWSRDHRHTSVTDVDLTDLGREQARRVGAVLDPGRFGLVVSSPRVRALHPAALAGFDAPTVLDDLTEWDYGAVEGRTTREISAELGHPWSVWTARPPDPVPAESVEELGRRADAVVARLRTATDGGADVLVFSHAHFLRVLACRWVELPAIAGRRLALSTGSVGSLGFEHDAPVITRWNVVP
jgi:probable phosphoglycerate mutase